MKRLLYFFLIALSAVTGLAKQKVTPPTPLLPVPNTNQLRWHDMEMYAFLHFSINTYTDQEWGGGNESPKLFLPAKLDARQWARVCKGAGMKGIILTVKHHCGFCLWPSAYTDYSVKSSPWKDGQGDVLRELQQACQEYGLKLGVYLSPWDRRQAFYGMPGYIDYFHNQLRELLTNYGDIFEVWFDGANGGTGYYGGDKGNRKIDATTYYQWQKTFSLIRELQPNIIIWSDAGARADARWTGTETGKVSSTNWNMVNSKIEKDYRQLHYGDADGDLWIPGEANTSVRPGWFYHRSEDSKVKSVSTLLDVYYRSVGRNTNLILNFPIMPNGLISSIDSLNALKFYQNVQETFKTNLLATAKAKASNVRGGDKAYAPEQALDGDKTTYWATDDDVKSATVTFTWKAPQTFNRFMAQEEISLGQRVKAFRVEAMVDGTWMSLKDALDDEKEGLTTIGHKRIVCFPTVKATALRFTVLDSRACPAISELGVYLAPKVTEKTAQVQAKAKGQTLRRLKSDSPRDVIFDLGDDNHISGFNYVPKENDKNGLVTDYVFYVSNDAQQWTEVRRGEFSNIENNPISQNVKFSPRKVRYVKFHAERMVQGNAPAFRELNIIFTKYRLSYMKQ